MRKLYLLTGPKNSGKSTRLIKWSKKQNKIAGIICPRDTGKRELFSIHSNAFKEFEVEDELRPVIKIGRYIFLKESFEWAAKEIKKSILLKPEWIVIDEIGPLELKGLGFDNIIQWLLKNKELKKSNLLFVIRDNLEEEVIQYYSLDKLKIQYIDFI